MSPKYINAVRNDGRTAGTHCKRTESYIELCRTYPSFSISVKNGLEATGGTSTFQAMQNGGYLQDIVVSAFYIIISLKQRNRFTKKNIFINGFLLYVVKLTNG